MTEPSTDRSAATDPAIPTDPAVTEDQAAQTAETDTAVIQPAGALHSLDALQSLYALLAQAHILARAGGMSPAATETQKWRAGDLVSAMQKVVGDARDSVLDPRIPVTPEATARYRACIAAYDAFLAGQKLTRGTLVDAGLTADTFPPTHSVRGIGLSFSHARTLTRIASARDRMAWAERAVRERLSVAALQALINTAGPGGADGDGVSVTEPGTVTGSVGRGRRAHHLHVCSFTGEDIADLNSMVEVRLTLDRAGRETLAARSVRPNPRGGAARAGMEARYPALLRFADLSVLAQWLTARDLKAREIEASEESPDGD